MTAHPFLVRSSLVLLMVAYAILFGWLAADTWHHSAKFDPQPAFTAAVPLLAGALGVMLARGLGVDPTRRIQGKNFGEKLRSFFTTDILLLSGAAVFLLSGIAGLIVWIHKGDVTPALLSTITLTVLGYMAASATNLAGGGGGGGEGDRNDGGSAPELPPGGAI